MIDEAIDRADAGRLERRGDPAGDIGPVGAFGPGRERGEIIDGNRDARLCCDLAPRPRMRARRQRGARKNRHQPAAAHRNSRSGIAAAIAR